MSAPKIYHTDDSRNWFHKFLIYGDAGSGKTPLALTAPDVFMAVSEPGLISLARNHIPYCVVNSYEISKDVIKWFGESSEAKKYQTLYFDGISAISEIIVAAERKKYNNDARKYSPETTAKVMDIVFSALSIETKNIVMTSKALKADIFYTPIGGMTQTKTSFECWTAVPKLGPALPYHFDNVFFLSRQRAQDGSEFGAFTCRVNDDANGCRNRSNALDLWEPADISHCINKINGAYAK